VIATALRILSQRLGEERGFAAFRFLSYVFVCAVALAVDLSVYRLALPALPLAALAAAVGFFVGNITHYIVSSRLVFNDILTERGYRTEAPVMVKFIAAGCTGFTVTTLIVWLIADVAGYHPFLAKGVAIVFSFVSVFAVMRFFVLGDFLKRATPA
jgi:putative flippase GtrA